MISSKATAIINSLARDFKETPKECMPGFYAAATIQLQAMASYEHSTFTTADFITASMEIPGDMAPHLVKKVEEGGVVTEVSAFTEALKIAAQREADTKTKLEEADTEIVSQAEPSEDQLVLA